MLQESVEVLSLGGGHSGIEVCLDFCGKLVLEGVELAGEVVFVEVVGGQALTCAAQVCADLADSLHVGFYLNAQLLAEEIDELDGGSS